MLATVRVSSSYRIVIPRNVRQALSIRRGQMLSVMAVGGVIEIVPDRDLATLEGTYPRISLTDVRDEPG